MKEVKTMTAKTGRPRTTTPEDDALHVLGKEIVKWATEPTEELRYHLNQWYCLKKGFRKKEWDLMCEKPVFRAYYEKARVAIARRYVDGSINASIANRFIRHYFPEVKKDEDALVVFKAQAAKKLEEESQDGLARKLVEAITHIEVVSGAQEAGRSEVETK